MSAVEPFTFRWGTSNSNKALHATSSHRNEDGALCGRPVRVDPFIGVASIARVLEKFGHVCGMCAFTIQRREDHRARQEAGLA